MTKTDEKILSYLSPSTDNQLLLYGNDTYFCGGSKHLKRDYIESRIIRVKNWVEKNGGKFTVKSDKMIRNTVVVHSDGRCFKEDRDGVIVQIIFPGYNNKTKKSMKEIMATLFEVENKNLRIGD